MSAELIRATLAESRICTSFLASAFSFIMDRTAYRADVRVNF